MGLHSGEQAIMDADWSMDPLDRLREMRAAREYLAYKIEQTVLEARTEERAKDVRYEPDTLNDSQREVTIFALATWQEIAEALGVTRQSAWRAYAHLLD